MNNHSPPTEKIALFRRLFGGRTDVYPRRFESKRTGKSGYQPACGNEWVRGICEKPRIRCGDCPHQKWLPVTDAEVRWHLSGRDAAGLDFVMGVYPMLLDEHCKFLAVDFDDGDWETDALAFLETARLRGFSAALERSRSGSGGHVWLFFADALSASLARKLGAALLTETMGRRPELGFASYDRFFPNQDTLPRGGFGNLIALPLQKVPRESGNSAFMELAEDGGLRLVEDQWAHLAALEENRIATAAVETYVAGAERLGRITGVKFVSMDEEETAPAAEPWKRTPSRAPRSLISGPLPKELEIVQSDQLYIPKVGLPPSLRGALLRLAAFQNPEFFKAQAMRLSTHDKPRIIACAEDLPEHIGLPRGCHEELLALLRGLRVTVTFRDERVTGTPLGMKFQGELRPAQKDAARALMETDIGVLAATTAFGKTVLAAWLIAQRDLPTLVLVHRQQLLEQWVERLSHFLGLPAKEIGRWGGGKRRLTGRVDVALLQSVARKGVVADEVANYGHLVVDECHHLSAHSFEMVARRTKARHVLGLSATVARKDGHHPIIFMQCGPVRHRVDAKSQAELRPFTHEVLVRSTGFFPEAHGADTGGDQVDMRKEFRRICEGIVRSETRNQMICDDVIQALKDGRHPVILTERTEHLERLAVMLTAQAPTARVISLRGGMGRKCLLQTLEELKSVPETEARVLVATGKFLGEGFDDSRLDTLFLTMPVSWRGTLAQYVGRLHRLHEGKRQALVYDYADLELPMCQRMFERRCGGYESLGYSILTPASAISGWPSQVPLPASAHWKHYYAASVKRLLRDGLDVPLAELFLRVAILNGEHVPEAAPRSASEAFLHRRLESHPQLEGKFRLNATLPIPFDQRSSLECDFLCNEAKIVLELDGDQHLANPDAWRRDRRKDMLLQLHGYLVYRVLTLDLGPRLGEILDNLLAMLVKRGKR